MQTVHEATAPAAPTPGRAGGRGAAPASFRLDERTSSDGPSRPPHATADDGYRSPLRTRVRLRTYPGGDCEATITRRPCTTSRHKGIYRGEPAGGAVERPAHRVVGDFARAATRARSTVRRSIQAGELDHMLTLTYRENRTDARQCHADLTRFLRLVRDAMPDEYKYVAVFERQKRGAGHWHLAVAGWQQVRLLRELWRRVVGDGNIDVRSWAGRGRSGECSAKLAGYLSKYITKEIDERAESAHRYRRSHNIVVEEWVEEFEDPDLGRVANAVFARFPGGKPQFILSSEAGSECFIWACSWGGVPGAADSVQIPGPLPTPPS